MNGRIQAGTALVMGLLQRYVFKFGSNGFEG